MMNHQEICLPPSTTSIFFLDTFKNKNFKNVSVSDLKG